MPRHPAPSSFRAAQAPGAQLLQRAGAAPRRTCNRRLVPELCRSCAGVMQQLGRSRGRRHGVGEAVATGPATRSAPAQLLHRAPPRPSDRRRDSVPPELCSNWAAAADVGTASEKPSPLARRGGAPLHNSCIANRRGPRTAVGTAFRRSYAGARRPHSAVGMAGRRRRGGRRAATAGEKIREGTGQRHAELLHSVSFRPPSPRRPQRCRSYAGVTATASHRNS